MTSRPFFSVIAAVPMALSLAACQGKKAQEPAQEAKPEAAAAEAPAQEEAAPAAQAAAPHTDCVGPITAEGEAKEIKVGEQTWELKGSTLTLKGEAKQLKLGALTDIKENSAENLQNLEAFIKWFKEQQVDAVVVAGDTGLNREQIAGSLKPLAQLGVPVFNIIGNREGRADYVAAMQEVAASGNVFNLNQIRRVDTPVVDIVSMPGYFNANYIHATDGCAYGPQQVEALGEAVKAANSPVLLVSHGGPLQTGEQALDRTAEGEHVGDPALTALIQKHNIPFGIFGNIHEAGGRATDLAGSTLLPQKAPQDTLYLNPGPADGVRWTMNDDSVSLGMAAILTVADGKASYEIYRVKDAVAQGGAK